MSHPLRIVLLASGLVTAGLALGCASEPASYETFEEACAAVPGCGESRYPIEGNLEPVFRVLVVRSPEGVFSIANAERIELVEGDGIPIGPAAGDVVLAGRDVSGEPVDGQMIRFPTTRLLEGLGEDPFSEEQSLEGEVTSMIGYVRALPDVTELALLGLDGSVVALAELPEPAVMEEGVSREALIATSSSACAHVRVVNGEADREWFNAEYPLVEPTALQRALIDATLGRMTPLLCHGLSRIALVDAPGETARGFVADSTGDIVNLNVGYQEGRFFSTTFFDDAALQGSQLNQVTWQRVLAHEVGHVLHNLLGPTGGPILPGPGERLTRPGARVLAVRTIDSVRIPEGLLASWGTLHQSFLNAGMADVYEMTDERQAYSPEQIARAGGMSKYGTTKASDDIAEMVAWLVTGPLFDAAGIAESEATYDRQDLGCWRMRAYAEGGVPGRYAALYTKMRFLQDLGAVGEADVVWCTGSRLGLDPVPPGFRIAQEGATTFSYSDATASVLSGANYRLEANGVANFDDTTYPAQAIMRLEFTETAGEVGFPRGIYPLTQTTPDTFEIFVEDRPAASFVVSDGFVLIASATNERIIGSIFVTEGFRYAAPFPVPQVFDPPLTISFLDNMPPR